VGNSRLIIVTDFLTVYGRHTERFLSLSLIAIAPSCNIFLFIALGEFKIRWLRQRNIVDSSDVSISELSYVRFPNIG